jgi:hypothetical protein
LAVALGFIAALVGIGLGAAATAWRSPMLRVFEACCVFPAEAFVIWSCGPRYPLSRAAVVRRRNDGRFGASDITSTRCPKPATRWTADR